MASSEVTVTLRAEVGPVVEALQVLITSTRTVLAALQTAVDNLEALRGVGGVSIGDTSVTEVECQECETSGRNCRAHGGGIGYGPESDSAVLHRSATDSWRCRRCGSPRWVAISRTGPVSHGGRAIRQCVPCGWVSRDPVPTPAGGAADAPRDDERERQGR